MSLYHTCTFHWASSSCIHLTCVHLLFESLYWLLFRPFAAFPPHCSLHYSRGCDMAPFRVAHDTACRSGSILTVSLMDGSTPRATDLVNCLKQSYSNASQLFPGQGMCAGDKAVLRNITCKSSQLSSSSSCSASCFLWFVNRVGGSSTLILLKNLRPNDINQLMADLVMLTCTDSQPPMSKSSCCETCESICTA